MSAKRKATRFENSGASTADWIGRTKERVIYAYDLATLAGGSSETKGFSQEDCERALQRVRGKMDGLSREELVEIARSAFGMWANRTDIGDSVEYVRKLRKGWRERLDEQQGLVWVEVRVDKQGVVQEEREGK